MYKYALGFWFIFLLGCHGDKPEALDFFEVTILDLNASELGALTLSGQLKNAPNLSDIEVQGFLYSTNIEAVENLNSNGNVVMVNSLEDDIFTADIPNLSLEKTYYFRAFAIGNDGSAGQRTTYSDRLSFSFQIQLTMLEMPERNNDELTVESFVTGLENLNLSVEAHGFVYDDESANLNINDHATVDFADLNDDGIFAGTLQNLNFNTTYFIQSYLKTPDTIYYSDNVLEYRVTDGWQQIVGPGTALRYAVGVAHNGKGYVALGENPFQNNEQMFTLDLNASPDFWTTTPMSFYFDSFDYFGEYKNNCVGFSLNNQLYLGLGNASGNNIFWTDIYCLLPNQQNSMDFLTSGNYVRRSDAIAFTINGRAYMGTGRDEDGTALADIWEYDPDTNSWREITPLPLKENEISPEVISGRIGASVFEFDNEIYVGGGHKTGLEYRDFWKFIPPDPTNPDDLGDWELYPEFFPGIARREAVSFVLEGRGYYGLGHQPSDIGFTDFWEFDPATGWHERTAFTGSPRTKPVFFGLDNRGIVGGGEVYFIDGIAISPQAVPDFWMYIPEN